jgi:hypothetical protein
LQHSRPSRTGSILRLKEKNILLCYMCLFLVPVVASFALAPTSCHLSVSHAWTSSSGTHTHNMCFVKLRPIAHAFGRSCPSQTSLLLSCITACNSVQVAAVRSSQGQFIFAIFILFFQPTQYSMDHFSGMHNWYACSHARPTYCNVCREALSGVTSHGLSCEGMKTAFVTLLRKVA